ncbi:hypothetical protein RN20_08015 [Xanthomonas phaseoli pv. phaseoli]|uniref:Uncharacterized protein n=1 Tax=Xanthomonas campestris pv. phaseoli TaxID=317013 RepID=A0AB34QIX4_XANCH|nr:hypothetical protein RN20_08015 [Xanthomonas phaseoli pv. phaseoli]
MKQRNLRIGHKKLWPGVKVSRAVGRMQQYINPLRIKRTSQFPVHQSKAVAAVERPFDAPQGKPRKRMPLPQHFARQIFVRIHGDCRLHEVRIRSVCRILCNRGLGYR